jgi:hypothetical protein
MRVPDGSLVGLERRDVTGQVAQEPVDRSCGRQDRQVLASLIEENHEGV